MKPRNSTADKQRAVARAYVTNGFKKGAAMRAAGYPEGSCRGKPCARVFASPFFVAELTRLMAPAKEKAEITAEWVREHLRERGDAGRTLAKFKKVDERGQLYWDFSEATEEELALAMRVIDELSTDVYTEGRGDDAREVKKTKIKGANPDISILTSARILGMLNDKLEVTGEMSLVERLRRGRLRAKPKQEE